MCFLKTPQYFAKKSSFTAIMRVKLLFFAEILRGLFFLFISKFSIETNVLNVVLHIN